MTLNSLEIRNIDGSLLMSVCPVRLDGSNNYEAAPVAEADSFGVYLRMTDDTDQHITDFATQAQAVTAIGDLRLRRYVSLVISQSAWAVVDGSRQVFSFTDFGFDDPNADHSELSAAFVATMKVGDYVTTGGGAQPVTVIVRIDNHAPDCDAVLFGRDCDDCPSDDKLEEAALYNALNQNGKDDCPYCKTPNTLITDKEKQTVTCESCGAVETTENAVDSLLLPPKRTIETAAYTKQYDVEKDHEHGPDDTLVIYYNAAGESVSMTVNESDDFERETSNAIDSDVLDDTTFNQLAAWVVRNEIPNTLKAAALPCKPCGLNADWSSCAWHLSAGKPNTTAGDYYILDDEQTDDQGMPTFSLVQRFYNDDIDNVKVIVGSASFDECIKQFVATMQTPKAEATPRPWRVAHEIEGRIVLHAPDGKCPISINGDPKHPENIANAALIVRAVNSFDALVEVAEQMAELECVAPDDCNHCLAKAALKLAQEVLITHGCASA